jgi:hypothetical protein
MLKYFDTDARGELLMWDMVQAMDIDLLEAVCSDALSFSAVERMLGRCNRCPSPQLCALFLDRRHGATDQAPSFCPNRKRLAALRQQYPTKPPIPH